MSTNMFIKFEDPAIGGASTGAGREQGIEILTWDARSGRNALAFSKYLDEATTALAECVRSGQQIGKATITCYRADGARDRTPVQYLKIVMERVTIADFRMDIGAGDFPVENISLDYEHIRFDYVRPDHDGD